jgi:anti-anti-sigma regulatory factor
MAPSLWKELDLYRQDIENRLEFARESSTINEMVVDSTSNAFVIQLNGELDDIHRWMALLGKKIS